MKVKYIYSKCASIIIRSTFPTAKIRENMLRISDGFNEIYGNETFLMQITRYLNSVNNFRQTSAKARM